MAHLPDILASTRDRVRALRRDRAALEQAASAAAAAPAWLPAVPGEHVAVIAEVKRRSPSAGAIAPDLDPARLAAAYADGGAAAISVLTDTPFFGGSLDDLAAVRAAVGLPVLRKDFLIDPVQLYESRAAGASAVLLIVRALDRGLLRELSDVARGLGLARLVEAHTADELEAAAALAPEAIGVNSRDLDAFTVSLDGIAPLLRLVPDGVLAVAESGIADRDDVARVAEWGADAVLVGTAVARAPDPARAVAALGSVARRGRTAA
jgi:indole-3-glycerol phosphate synthase